MDNRKRGSRWVLVTGVLITVLGLIHVAFTPSIFQTLSSQLDVYSTWVQVYMFAATGAAVIFAGLLIVYASRGLKTSEGWARSLALWSGLFSLLLGGGAVAAIPGSPFALMLLLVSSAEIIPLWLYRREFRQAEPPR